MGAAHRDGWNSKMAASLIVALMIVPTAIAAGPGGGDEVAGAPSCTWDPAHDKITTTDAAFRDAFGQAISLSGDRLAIGAPSYVDPPGLEPGSVYVCKRVAGGSWVLEAEIFSAVAGARDRFGFSVSLDGDTLAIGAPFHDDSTGTDQGMVEVWTFASGSWVLQQRILAGDPHSYAFFGYAVSLQGNTLAVGGPGEDHAGTDVGGVEVWTRNTVWTHQQKFWADQPGAGDSFGVYLSLDQDTVAIGSNRDDLGSSNNQGSVEVWVRTGPVWAFQQKLTASAPGANDQFGVRLSLEGNTVAIGAPYHDDSSGGVDQGSVEVWVRNVNTMVWAHRQTLLANDPGANDFFGASVSLDGTHLAIGSQSDTVGVADRGSAEMWRRVGATWSFERKFVANDGVNGDELGTSISLDGGLLAIGARYDEVPGPNLNQGSVYVFEAPACDFHTAPGKITASDGAETDTFGDAVSLDGNRVAIGAPLDEGPAGADQGSVYICKKAQGTWVLEQKIRANGPGAGDSFGRAVSLKGTQLLIGAPGDDGMLTDQGSVEVWTRVGSTWTFQQKFFANDPGAGDVFGHSVSISGSAVAVGAERDDKGALDSENQGSVEVWRRTGTVWAFEQKMVGFERDERFGYAVSIAGDTLAIGAPTYTPVDLRNGYVEVWRQKGNLPPLWSLEKTILASNLDPGNDFFGFSVSLEGNSLAIGAPGDDDNIADRGVAEVWTRDAFNAWTRQNKIWANHPGAGDHFGWSVSLSGNTLAVGAPYDENGGVTLQGSVEAWRRFAGVWNFHRKILANDGATIDTFGDAISLSGNVLAIGAWFDDEAAVDQGSVYIVPNVLPKRDWFSDGTTLTTIGPAIADLGGLIVDPPFDPLNVKTRMHSAGAWWLLEGVFSSPELRERLPADFRIDVQLSRTGMPDATFTATVRGSKLASVGPGEPGNAEFTLSMSEAAALSVINAFDRARTAQLLFAEGYIAANAASQTGKIALKAASSGAGASFLKSEPYGVGSTVILGDAAKPLESAGAASPGLFKVTFGDATYLVDRFGGRVGFAPAAPTLPPGVAVGGLGPGSGAMTTSREARGLLVSNDPDLSATRSAFSALMGRSMAGVMAPPRSSDDGEADDAGLGTPGPAGAPPEGGAIFDRWGNRVAYRQKAEAFLAAVDDVQGSGAPRGSPLLPCVPAGSGMASNAADGENETLRMSGFYLGARAMDGVRTKLCGDGKEGGWPDFLAAGNCPTCPPPGTTCETQCAYATDVAHCLWACRHTGLVRLAREKDEAGGA